MNKGLGLNPTRTMHGLPTRVGTAHPVDLLVGVGAQDLGKQRYITSRPTSF